MKGHTAHAFSFQESSVCGRAMATNRRKVGFCSLFGLIVVMVFGILLLQRMWTFHSALRDAQGNAAHLEKLYEEALDEASDWRNKYDTDVQKVTEALEEKTKIIKTLETKMESLRKVKQDLEEKVVELKGELVVEKRKCEMLSSVKEINREAAT